MKRGARADLALLLISTAVALLVLEGTARLLVRPSPISSGRLLGRELPPLRVVAPRPPAAPAAATASATDAEAITWDDLQGPLREDPRLGYVTREATRSPHGWWVANNIGARSVTDTSPATLPGRTRILIFGESFASGSRVRQEEAWATLLGAGRDDREVVNLAVDGYGMGQSLLRFRDTTARIDYDVAVLVFAPSVDLWRDVNTVRALAKRSWNSYTVMPRFVVEGDRLVLVESPYEIGTDVYRDNADGLSETLRRHLRQYDRFYFPTQYEPVPVVGRLVLGKLALSAYFWWRKSSLLHSVGSGHVDLDSEAMEVTRKIFEAMRAETRARGKQFLIVILPDHHALEKLRKRRGSAENWARMVATLCAGGIDCVDLGAGLLGTPREDLDHGYDGSHYGPRMSRVVARLIEPRLP